MERFDQTYSYKLIYVISMPYETHRGFLKVGEATLTTDIKPTELVPNCRALNQAAKHRIDSYTKTASLSYKLEYTELAIKLEDGYSFAFKDKDVHKVLMNSGVHKVQPNGATGEEWFDTNVETVKGAIKAVKDGKDSIGSASVINEATYSPIDFREEQLDAVDRTIKAFKKDNEMLWYAKMRFGKTLTALEVIRRAQYRRVIIVTHRPVVDDGWSEDFKKIFFPGNSKNEYHYERKTKDSTYTFDEKTDSENDLKIRRLDKDGAFFIYFASIQDLRGSQLVGGNFNKNNAVFALEWDLIVIDEAHEGTQTQLGDNVIKLLRKDKTKVLALSGTPFNLLSQYSEDNVYTWDYVMEQRKKTEWDLFHHGDHNPYADLPKMHIFTYDLGEKLKKYVTDEYETKAFNFREFFRVWYKGPNGKRELPKGAVEGEFVHEDDVLSFLNMMVKEGLESGYPFSTQEYRDMFRHTLWMVPGVKEARALSELLRKHPVFQYYGIANVAGEGDRYEEEHPKDALELVRDTISSHKHSITLSCGKLTTGVTVKEWTAVLMLSGSYTTAAAQYMQTIFRVQSAGSIDGRQKTDCYVFDFAPDRTLKVLAETVHLSRKPGKSQQKRREAMTEFLNYCPVIAIAGSKTKKYSVESMMEQIKQIYAERAVNSGFEDESIYNDELLRLDEIDASKFNELQDIIGTSKAQKKKGEVKVNGQGLTDEQIEHIDDPDQPDTPGVSEPLTPEQIAERLAKKQAKEARKKAIDILRGISIRMPLLIYGADVSIEEDIGIERFVDLVDDESWKEFMPQGVTKEIFADFTKYYDRDVFIAAGKRIRKLAAAADKETPTRRVILIAEIFRHFKNPDKETVLTPWRVVNMHMSDTLGGWCFFNERFEEDSQEEKHRLDEPRFVDRGEVTSAVFAEKAQILEINSKTGLYPLYVAYSFYKQKMEGMSDDDWEPEECQVFWEEVIRDNVFVICKTPMAKSITRRTLCGYSNVSINAHYSDDLVNMLKNKPEQFRKKVLKGSYWKKEVKEMRFDAIVGNPPYQLSGGSGGTNDAPIYQHFVMAAKKLNPAYVSMIMPSRWFSAGRENLIGDFRKDMITSGSLRLMRVFTNSRDLFSSVEIKGGLCYFLIDMGYNGSCEYTLVNEDGTATYDRKLDDFDIIIREPILSEIAKKVASYSEESIVPIISNDTPFGIPTNVDKSKKNPIRIYSQKSPDHDTAVYYIESNQRKKAYLDRSIISKNKEAIDSIKVLLTSAGGSGNDPIVLGRPEYAVENSVCSQSFLYVPFDTEMEAKCFIKYVETKFLRALVSAAKISQSAPNKVYRFVPMQQFGDGSDINWKSSIREIDESLFAKYKLSEDEIQFINSHYKYMNE